MHRLTPNHGSIEATTKKRANCDGYDPYRNASNYQLMLRNLMVTLQEYLVLMNDDIERGAQKSLELVDREAGHKDDHMICIWLQDCEPNSLRRYDLGNLSLVGSLRA